MKFTERLRCKYLFAKSRFAEALALDSRGHFLSGSERIWALYNLGCYRSVSSHQRVPMCGREAVAYGVANAAVGQIDQGVALIHAASKSGLIAAKALVRAARGIAPYSPTTALHLLRLNKCFDRGLEAAILLSLGHVEEAFSIIERSLEDGLDRKEPDLLLLHANAVGRTEFALHSVNAYLERHGLAPLALKDSHHPLSTGNLTTELKPATIHGPLVTVTMPSYNSSERIGSAIESLLAQTYRDIEVLVVDDGSTDDTVNVVKRFAFVDSRVRLIERSQNGGPYAARNVALTNASGDFVTCHDSDDWAHPQKIATQVKPLLSDRRLAFTMSNWVRLADDGQFYARQLYPLTRLNPASPLFRRVPALNQAGFYDNVRTGADSEYIARLKLVFGRSAWKKLAHPLAFGAHRAGSLMTDSATGTQRGSAMNAQRLEYWETWTMRHIDALNQRASLYRGFKQM